MFVDHFLVVSLKSIRIVYVELIITGLIINHLHLVLNSDTRGRGQGSLRRW